MSYLNNFKSELATRLKKNKQNRKKDDKDTINDEAQKNKTQTQIKNVSVNDTNKQNATNNIILNAEEVTKDSNNNITNVPKTLVTGQVPEATKNDDPVEKLKELEERYELLEFYDVPDSLNLEKKEVPVFDEDENRNKLQSKYDAEYADKKDNLNIEYERAVADLTDEKNLSKIQAQDKENVINSTYDNQSKTLENQAIKRGLARSSIILGQLASVESERASDLIENMNTLESSLADIESEIEDKKLNLDLALEKLDIEKADKIESELEKAYKEYQNTLNDVIGFNNNVNKLEAEYKLKYEKAKTEYKDSVLDLTKYGYDEFTKKLEISKYDYMISYLSQFNKDDAFEIFFRNNNFKELLGEFYYQKIVDYLYSRL